MCRPFGEAASATAKELLNERFFVEIPSFHSPIYRKTGIRRLQTLSAIVRNVAGIFGLGWLYAVPL